METRHRKEYRPQNYASGKLQYIKGNFYILDNDKIFGRKSKPREEEPSMYNYYWLDF